MPRPKNSVPTYRRHKQSGQAIATVRASNGQRKDVLLGEHNSPQSHEAYRRLLAELDQHRGAVSSSSTASLSVNEVLVRFWQHAKVHYRHPDGRPTSEINNYKLSLKPFRELYGMTRANEFGPLGLKAVRQRMIENGWCRTAINGRIGRIRRVFKWAASEEIVPVGVYQSLSTVSGLQSGRSAAAERDPIKPVDDEHVEATLPFLNRHVAGLVDSHYRNDG